MSTIPFLLLIIFSAFTMNLTLQCALGIKGAFESKSCTKKSTLINLVLIFSIIILLWFFLSRIIFSLFSGYFIYVLVFPLSFIVYEGIYYLFVKFIFKNDIQKESFINFPGGITAASVFICLNISASFLETVILSFGFTFGIMMVFLIIREIRRRAALESIHFFLRGNPLIFISLGLLSLIFTTVSLLILGIIGIR